MPEYDGDSQILRGLDALVNKDNVAPGIDLVALERQLINEPPTPAEEDPALPLDTYINNLGGHYGVDVSDIIAAIPAKSSPAAYGASEVRRSSPSTDIRASARPTPPAVYDEEETSVYDHDELAVPEDLYARKKGDFESSVTREQARRQSFNSVVAQDSTFSSTLEHGINSEDEKADMLADIELLLSALEADGVDTTTLQSSRPNQTSHISAVQSYCRALQKKVDRQRGSAIVEEMVIFGTSLLEDLFDGKNEWFGYKPDLTGYSNTARTKMRRLRPESSVLASSVLQSGSMGPGMRMMLELIPSMVLHTRSRRQQHGEAGLFDDSTMADANTTIRRFA